MKNFNISNSKQLTIRKYSNEFGAPFKKLLSDLGQLGFSGKADDLLSIDLLVNLIKKYNHPINESIFSYYDSSDSSELLNLEKKFLLLNEIRAAAKRESLRLENVSNRPRYFISGFKDLKQLKTQLSIFFTSAPDRVIDQCAFDEESTFKIADVFIKGSMSYKKNILTVKIPIKQIDEHTVNVANLIEAVKYGIYYIFDSRKLASFLVYFLERSVNYDNLLLDALLKRMSTNSIYIKKLQLLDLDSSQLDAIDKATKNNITFIWGPPGTGKTTTMAALAATLVFNGQRVLLSAQSNNALDQILFATFNRLQSAGIECSISRLGSSDNLCYGFTKHAFETGSFLASKSGNTLHWNDHISKSTLVAANFTHLTLDHYNFIGDFDYVLADEVSMSSVPLLLAPTHFTKKNVVFGGDPNQLPPPYPEDSTPSNKWFSENIFQKVLASDYFGDIVSFLNIQYRMHPDISELVSNLFYDGKLICSDDVCQLSTPLKSRIIFINTKSPVSDSLEICNYIDSHSRHNFNHASLVCKAIKLSLDIGYLPEEIGIIAPYNAQVALIQHMLQLFGDKTFIELELTKIQVSTVHSFQGQEKKLIIIDFTDNDIPPTPLTAKGCLINVALSRAKEQLFLVGNKDYITDKKFFTEAEILIFNEILNKSLVIDELEI